MGPAQNTQKYLDDPGPPRDNKFKGQKLADLLKDILSILFWCRRGCQNDFSSKKL